MTHNVKACLYDSVTACQLILKFTEEISLQEYQENLLVKSAVERQFEILGEALNRIKKLDPDLLSDISDCQKIIAFRNVIAHGYDAIDDEIVFLVIQRQIPELLEAIKEFSRRQDLEESLIKIVKELDITAIQCEEVFEKIEDLGKWLVRDESSIKNYSPKIYSHGSFLLGTLIKPVSNEDEYYIDLVCQLDLKRDSMTQKQLKEIIGVEIKKYVRGKGTVDFEQEGKKCWRIKVGDNAQFHLNIMPAITGSNTNGSVFSDTEIAITDNSLPNYSKMGIEWPQSNPKGFALWFKKQMEKQVKVSNDRGVSRGDVPVSRVKTALQLSVQVLKRHRDIVFVGKSAKPLSIIITVLAAMAYEGEANVVEALKGILERIENCFTKINCKAVLRNPICEKELLTDRWTKTDEEEFFNWLKAAKKNIFSWIVKGGHI